MTIDLGALDARYSTLLCDIWGVLHDGTALFPGVLERLQQWSEQGRKIILITNAPRTAGDVRMQLDALGLLRESYHDITTGGQAGIDALLKVPDRIGFIGTMADRRDLARAGLRFAVDGFAELACTGLDEQRHGVEEYKEQLEQLVERDVRLHCLNPDRIVIVAGRPEVCAGAIADVYEALGGRTCWYGKPWPAIYEHALGLAGNPRPDHVLAIGDGLVTDVLGAARNGLDCLFVSGGVHRGQPFPADFVESNGLGEWRPIGTVPTIGVDPSIRSQTRVPLAFR